MIKSKSKRPIAIDRDYDKMFSPPDTFSCDTPEKRLLISLLVNALAECDLNPGPRKSVSFFRNQCTRHAARCWVMDDISRDPFSIMWVLEHLVDQPEMVYAHIRKTLESMNAPRTFSAFKKRQRINAFISVDSDPAQPSE